MTNETMDILEAMRGQEEGAYTLPIKSLVRSLTPEIELGVNKSGTKKQLSRDMMDYIIWRKQMATWCLEIADYLHQHTETVEITLSILDRAAAADPAILEDPQVYQLACAASLYIASKVHENKRMTIEEVERLCLFRFSQKSILAMEEHILLSTNWRVNPPTAVSFARNLLNLLDLNEKHKEIVMNAVERQVEKAVVEEYFLTVKTSTLALAAVMNGLQLVCKSKLMQYFELFQQSLGYKASLPSRFTDVCSRLRPFAGTSAHFIEQQIKSIATEGVSSSHCKRSLASNFKYRQ